MDRQCSGSWTVSVDGETGEVRRSRLAGEGSGSATAALSEPTHSRASALLQWVGIKPDVWVVCKSVGAGLLANAFVQPP